MAKCDEGYPCDVCGKDVESILESGLYLSYVIGEVDSERLHVAAERHIRCHPLLAQFIVSDDFPPVTVEGAFGKSALDQEYVRQREALVTRGYQRLREILGAGEISMLEYPLPEVIEAMHRAAD